MLNYLISNRSPTLNLDEYSYSMSDGKNDYGSGFSKKDYDHKTSTFKSVKANRGNDGQGTKKEGKNNDAPHEHDIPQINFLLDKFNNSDIYYLNIKKFS